jgi:hypothetical protein
MQVRQNLFPPQPKAPSRYEMAVTYGLLNSLLEDKPGQSGKVVLLFPPRSEMDAETEQSYEEGFIPLLRHAHVRLDLQAVRLEGGDADLAAFRQALAQTQEAMAVISYAGVPAGFETLFSGASPESPSFYVFDSAGTTNWLVALKSGRIKAVVMPRPGVDSRHREAITGLPKTIFDRFYLLVTLANADEVAASLKTGSKMQR